MSYNFTFRYLTRFFILVLLSGFMTISSVQAQSSRVWAQAGLIGGALALADFSIGVISGVVYVATGGHASWFLSENSQLFKAKNTIDRDELRYNLDKTLTKYGFRYLRSYRRSVKEELFVDVYGNIVQVKIKRGNRYRIRLIKGRNSTLGDFSILASDNKEPSIPEHIWLAKQAKKENRDLDQLSSLTAAKTLTTAKIRSNNFYLMKQVLKVIVDLDSSKS